VLFWSGEMLKRITQNTNIYAKLQGAEHTRNGKGQGHSWKELTVDELKIWLGITILMGVTREPSVKDYWRNDDGCNSVHRFTEFMSLSRFEQIKRYIHISLPQEDDGKLTPESENERPDLWYSKVAWLLDHLEACSRSFRTVGSNVSVDEVMIQFTGRTFHKYYMRNKPISEGYKFFVLAERGYVYAIYPETPVHSLRAPLDVPNNPGNLTHTSEVVIHLLNKLPRHKHHFNVALDNYFMDPRLFRYLKKEFSMGAYGTLRTGVIRKKRWLRDARGERVHAHHARHAKHACHEKVPLRTPQRTMQRAHGVGTACAQSINADRRTAR
jgi:hypothetical protein